MLQNQIIFLLEATGEVCEVSLLKKCYLRVKSHVGINIFQNNLTCRKKNHSSQ